MPRPSVREFIAGSALAEFHRLGFAACSVDTITRAAGVPKGSFYNHFSSKEDLAAKTVVRYVAESGWGAQADPGLSALERLRADFQMLADVLAGNGFTRGCLMGNLGAEVADHSETIRAQLEESLATWSASIAESIRAAQATGEMAAGGDADMLARFVLNAWEGALIRARVVKGAEPLDDFFTVVFDTILR